MPEVRAKLAAAALARLEARTLGKEKGLARRLLGRMPWSLFKELALHVITAVAADAPLTATITRVRLVPFSDSEQQGLVNL